MQHASTLAAPPPIADGRLAGSSDPTLTRDEWNAHAVAYVFADEFAGRWWLEGSLRVYLYCCWQTMKPGLSEPDRKEYLWRLGYLNESPLATMAISEIDHRAIEAGAGPTPPARNDAAGCRQRARVARRGAPRRSRRTCLRG